MLSVYRNRIFSSVKNFGVNCYIFCCSHSGLVFRPEFCFLMKPGVHCQAKRQNKFENIHLSEIYRQNTKQRKFSLTSLALQFQADFAILHSYTTNADYSPDSDCGSVSELISKFYINEINLRTLKSLNTALNCWGQIQPNCKQLTIGSSQCNC